MIRLAQTQTKFIRSLKNSITYTRQHFQNLNIDKEQIQRNRKQQQIMKLKQTINSIKSNDKNSNNYIKKLKIDNQAFSHYDKIKQQSQVNQCSIIIPEPKIAPVRIYSVRRTIKTKLKKAVMAMKIIRKMYIYDAIATLQNSQKKVAKAMLPTFYNLVRHAIQRGLDPLRLFVHGLIIGKTMAFKGIRYHAKGKGGREIKHICQIKVIIQQKDQKQFWEQVGSGSAPPGFAAIVRNRLMTIGAGYNQLVSLGCITTAKGRQQKRQIIKRRISLKMKQNEQENTYVPKKTIEKQIRQQQGIKIKQDFYGLKTPQDAPSVTNRQKIFKKNMGIE